MMKKRIISVLLCFVMIISLSPQITIFAHATDESSGTCGDGVSWELDSSGTLTISGYGDMDDYSSVTDVPWYSVRNYRYYSSLHSGIVKVVIENGVTSIGNNAFNDCEYLTSVDMASSVTTIGYNAFSECSALESISLGAGVTTIGGKAFYYCKKLKNVGIPYGVKRIEYDAFSYCTALEEINIPNSVTKLGEGAFEHCSALKRISLSDNITSISKETFYYCSSLTSIELPEKATSIGEYAFYGCSSLSSIAIPPSVTVIGDYALRRTNNLTLVCDGESAAHAYAINEDINYELGDGSYYAGQGTCGTGVCWVIDSYGNMVIFGNGNINSYAFSNDTKGIEEVVIRSGITGIGANAFYNCDNLTYVKMDKTVTIIENSAFKNCEALETVIMADNVTTIEDNAFSGCKSLKKIDLSEKLTAIGTNTFSGCAALEKVILHKKVASLGSNAFYGCSSLGKVTILNNKITINASAFSGCTSLKTIYCGENSAAYNHTRTAEFIKEHPFLKCVFINTATYSESKGIENKDLSGLSNFTNVNSYVKGKFSDVYDFSWYSASVKKAYELDLIKGTNGKFNPTGNMTIAEALALAARIHCIYGGANAGFVQGNPWYQVYVDYAVANGIISRSEFPDVTKKINRAQFARIFAKVIPQKELTAINTVTVIPDVTTKDYFEKDVKLLYNAGILTGSDKYGTFNPYSNIQRSEVATIATRIVDQTVRQKFTQEKRPLATDVTISGKTSIMAGESVKWTATVMPATADSTVTWTTGNPGVATVDQNGNIKALKEGQANISVIASNGVKKTVLLTVTKYIPPTITLSGSTTIEVGSTVQWKATVSPAKTDVKITWASGNTSVATVDQNGNIKALKAGQSNITATASNGAKKTVLLTVKNKETNEARGQIILKRTPTIKMYSSSGGYVAIESVKISGVKADQNTDTFYVTVSGTNSGFTGNGRSIKAVLHDKSGGVVDSKTVDIGSSGAFKNQIVFSKLPASGTYYLSFEQ